MCHDRDRQNSILMPHWYVITIVRHILRKSAEQNLGGAQIVSPQRRHRMDDSKPRACDGCRSRKRKCDMLHPYCTNCQKSSVRDSNGNPICTYSMVTKKRGPKKGYKDTLIKRLESLEGILRPLAQRQGGNLEQRLQALSDLATGYVQNDDMSGSEEEVEVSGSVENYLGETFMMPASGYSPDFSTAQTLFTNNLVTGTDGIFFPVTTEGLGSFITPLQEPETLEVNLVRLGYMMSKHIELSVNHRLAIFTPEPNIAVLPLCLKEALCASGVLYSTHPDLFSSVIDHTGGQSSKQIRLRMARMYIRRCEQAVQTALNVAMGQPATEGWQPNAGSIIVIMVLETDAKPWDTLVLYLTIGEAYEFSHRYRLFHPFVFDKQYTSNSALTADDIMYNVPPVGPTFPIPLRELTPVERHERFLLWASLMAIDTYASFVAGHNPNIDEYRFNHLVRLIPGYLKNTPSFDYSHVPDSSFIAVHNLYEFGPFSVMFQDMKNAEMIGNDLQDTAYIFSDQISLILVMRNVMHTVRHGHKNLYESSDFATEKLHQELLNWYARQPQEFRPYESLEIFVNGTLDPMLLTGKEVWRLRGLSISNVILSLAGLVWLHLPLIQTSTEKTRMFLLSKASTKEFTSRQVILACFGAIVYLVKALYTPIHAEQSRFPRRASITDTNLVLAQDLPSPALAFVAHNMHIYMIASAAVIASRTVEKPEGSASVIADVNQVILPCLDRLSSIWPIGLYFSGKLRGILKGGDAVYWSQEANKY
ncbi:hypothetical protein EDD86DRAFT_109439 [Gorgonomyces haynaldii]|nr:hypothetical protein EDD86DRAFT_109439 [Gorgonomyces haynaldii]